MPADSALTAPIALHAAASPRARIVAGGGVHVGDGAPVHAHHRLTLSGLAAIQGTYLLVSGVAPLLSMRAFERITGPKRDDWLVRTVGLLAVGFGVVLARDARDECPDPLTGVAAALPFAAVSGWYGATGRISRIYLADAAVELVFAALWAAAATRDLAGEDLG